MTYKIDKNVPIPESNLRGSKYPIREMKVGDSFYLESEGEVKGARDAALKHIKRQKNGYKDWDYTTRKDGDGYRLWRVK